VKFARQFAAAALVVTVVVLAGLAWSRANPSLPGEGPAGPARPVPGRAVRNWAVRGHLVLPPGVKPQPGGRPASGGPAGIVGNDGSGIPAMLPGDLLEPVNLAVLRHTAMLEAAIIAAVIIVDASYRRARRARRSKRGSPATPAGR